MVTLSRRSRSCGKPSEGALALSSTRSWSSSRCTSAAARFSSSCEALVAPSSGMTLSAPFRPLSPGSSPRPLNALQPGRPDMTLSLVEALTPALVEALTPALVEALTPALVEHVRGRDLDVAVVTDGPGGAGLPASLD